jgi:hypothetical protein
MVERATVRQKKTSRPVCFELTEQTRLSVDAYLSQSLRSLCHRQTLSRVPVLPEFTAVLSNRELVCTSLSLTQRYRFCRDCAILYLHFTSSPSYPADLAI